MDVRRKGILWIVCAALLWSTGGIGIKAVDDAALKVTFYRSLFAGLTLLLLFGPTVVRRRWTSTTSFVTAIVSYGACLTTFVIATKWTTAANAIFLQYAGVVWVLLLSPLVLREPLIGRDVTAVAISLFGMALFFFGRLEARGAAGNAVALLSSVFFAMLILMLRRERAASESAVTIGNLVLAVALFPFVLRDLSLSPRSLAVFLGLGIFQIAIAYACFVRGLRHVTATEASLTGMLEPVANPLWVVLLLGERPSTYAVIGGMIVLAAIAWHTLSGRAVAEMLPPD